MNEENISFKFKTKRVYSIEVFPPKKDSSFDAVHNTLYGISDLPVDYVSVTYGAGGSQLQKEKTLEIATLLNNECGIIPLSHLTCMGSTKENMANILDKLYAEGVYNILALRGDKNPDAGVLSDFEHASDLVSFIKQYNPNLNVVAACYPEGHFESDTIDIDIENLKRKVDAGVGHLVTQLFFNNDCFYSFLDKATKAGINVPIQAGIMPIINTKQIERTVSMCAASIPHRFSNMLSKYSDQPESLKAAGIQFACEQIFDLCRNGVAGIHLYTLNNIDLAKNITDIIKDDLL